MASSSSDPVSSSCNRRNFLKCCLLVVATLILVQFMTLKSFSLNYTSLVNFTDTYFLRKNISVYLNPPGVPLSPNVSNRTLTSRITTLPLTSRNTTLHTKVVNNSSSVNVNSTSTQRCPEDPPNLRGPLATFRDALTFEELEKIFPEIQAGGRFRPSECVSRHKVAIIIPYRDREEQLRILLYNLHAMLTRQLIDYGIYVVDEALPTKFNRAMLMNIGYNEAIKIYDYQCFIFHDVDLIPQDDRLLYNCPPHPRHMSAAIDKFNYKLPYQALFGGVSALTKEQFTKVNGFSNMYFGWGGEDDDMYKRIKKNGYKVIRYPMNIARYRMIKHKRDKGNEPNPRRSMQLRGAEKRSEREGLSTLKYKVLHLEEKKLYTWVHVEIDENEIMQPWRSIISYISRTKTNPENTATEFTVDLPKQLNLQEKWERASLDVELSSNFKSDISFICIDECEKSVFCGTSYPVLPS
ncbi:hypothetical protein ScPMuIL_012721, partial [Solemya velum]